MPNRRSESPTSAPGQVLNARQLNRALLARQLLLRRENRTSIDTVEHLVDMQAQVPSNPYLGLWSRLEEFQPEEVSRLIAGRKLVRPTLMRTTIHLVSARDCLALRPLMQPLMVRTLSSTAWGKAIKDVEHEDFIAAGRELLEEQPRSRAELGPLLQERWPDVDAASLAWAVSYPGPVVQVPPVVSGARAAWRGSRPSNRGSATRSIPIRRPTRWSCGTWARSDPRRPPMCERGRVWPG